MTLPNIMRSQKRHNKILYSFTSITLTYFVISKMSQKLDKMLWNVCLFLWCLKMSQNIEQKRVTKCLFILWVLEHVTIKFNQNVTKKWTKTSKRKSWIFLLIKKKKAFCVFLETKLNLIWVKTKNSPWHACTYSFLWLSLY